ncbi:MAG: hypothetical protein WAK82_31230 [Streptosporangiaceae bacterium]
MAPVLGCQLVDAGDQELPLRVTRVFLAARVLVVVVQPGGLGGGGADCGDGHVEASGQRVDGGRARRPGQVPRRGEGVEGGVGQSAAAGDLAVGPALLAQSLLDEPLERVHVMLRRGGGGRPLGGGVLPVPRRMHRHDHQPSRPFP